MVNGTCYLIIEFFINQFKLVRLIFFYLERVFRAIRKKSIVFMDVSCIKALLESYTKGINNDKMKSFYMGGNCNAFIG